MLVGFLYPAGRLTTRPPQRHLLRRRPLVRRNPHPHPYPANHPSRHRGRPSALVPR